jgi:hypothetical protein
MKFFLSAFLLPTVLLTLFSGCATNSIDPKDETLSMVYGYMGGNSSLFGPMTWGNLKEIRQPAAYHKLNVVRNFSERGGMFWHMGLKPGSYQMDDFGLPNGTYLYGKASKNITAIRITEPGLYYMGSYWHENNSKIIVIGFDIKRINKPTEREIVQRLIKEFESEGNNKVYVRQYNLLKKRLAELSQ